MDKIETPDNTKIKVIITGKKKEIYLKANNVIYWLEFTALNTNHIFQKKLLKELVKNLKEELARAIKENS